MEKKKKGGVGVTQFNTTQTSWASYKGFFIHYYHHLIKFFNIQKGHPGHFNLKKSCCCWLGWLAEEEEELCPNLLSFVFRVHTSYKWWERERERERECSPLRDSECRSQKNYSLHFALTLEEFCLNLWQQQIWREVWNFEAPCVFFFFFFFRSILYLLSLLFFCFCFFGSSLGVIIKK